jgi:hypothetical protein
MRKFLPKLAGLIDLRDGFTFGGLALVGYGLHAIYPPAAFVVVGAVLFWIGVR